MIKKHNIIWLGALFLMPLFLFTILAAFFPLPEDKLHPEPSIRITDRAGRTLRVYTSQAGNYHFPVELHEISDYLISSVIAFEDRWFFYHPGFNPVSILRALRLNLQAGRVVSGGSTITQQVARLIERRPRTVSSKIIEAFRTLQLELHYSKKEILEFYFNLAPYGGNIQGAAAASEIYFGKRLDNLGPGEAALLSALPNAPTRLRPDINQIAARKRRAEVLSRMLKLGKIDTDRYQIALDEAVPGSRRRFPFHAPHLCDLLLKYRTTHNQTTTIQSSLDLDIQELCRKLLLRRLSLLTHRKISNGSVVVIENQTGAVRALVGSADYFSQTDSGQVNGAIAVRSPGSTLKPFAYGLGFDAGIISPATMLEDIPHDYGGYTPHNYDEIFHGTVSAEEALIRSMNVPAVFLVNRTGYTKLYNLLKNGGFTTLDKSSEYYGLQMILGGVGVRLIELTNLFSCLANGGSFQNYTLLEKPQTASDERLFSEAASYMLTEILSQLQRPDFPSSWEYSVNLPRIAWKTGTSYGHRDAWSVGYTPRYTVGVWLGNFSGEGSPALVGAEIAGPLLFDIFSELEGKDGKWFERAKSVDEREVCVLSGMAPGVECETTVSEMYIPSVSPSKKCTLHLSYVIDDHTGYRLCPQCWVDSKKHRQTFLQYSPGITTWMKENGMPLSRIPVHNPLCRMMVDGQAPVIISPSDECEYILREGIPLTDQRILLEASVPADVKTLFWFLDGNLIYKGTPAVPQFLNPVRGQHQIVCMDEEGRAARRLLVVL